MAYQYTSNCVATSTYKPMQIKNLGWFSEGAYILDIKFKPNQMRENGE